MKEHKKPLFFVDTNIFLRIFVKEDEKTYKDCLNFLKLVSAKKIKAYISTIVIMEINFVLTSFYKFQKENTAQALRSIISTPGLKIIDDLDISHALELYTNSNIKFMDCLIASSSLLQKNKACIITYDKDFEKLPVITKQPGEII